MKIINTKRKEVIGRIIGGEMLTLDEALNLMQIKVMQTEEDYEDADGEEWEELDYVSDSFEFEEESEE